MVAMLEEYLPTLPSQYRFGAVKPLVPPEMLAVLREAVRLRNEATHAGSSITQENLTEVLLTVHDLLYLLDFYCGQLWAIELMQRHRKHVEAAIEKAKKGTVKG